jgi:hypothetical protein
MEPDQPEEEKHVTKAVTTEPQEEFIEPKARPSQTERDALPPVRPEEE